MSTNDVVHPDGSSWYAWAGLALCSFAILERRAIKSGRKHATLSHVVRRHTRRNRKTELFATGAYVGFTAWLGYHFWFEKLDSDGFSGTII